MNWIAAARPKTLLLSLTPVILGACFAFFNENPEWFLLPFILLSAVMIQVGTNYINDGIDFIKGADNSERLGPARMALSSGDSTKVLHAGILCFIFALIAAIPLIIYGSWPVLLIGLVALALGYSYTAGPFPLAYLGIGEPFVVIYFGIIPVATTVYLLTGHFGELEIVSGLQMGMLASCLLILNNLRDVDQDRKAHKKTFVVRFGEKAGLYHYYFFHFGAFLLGIFYNEIPRMGLIPLLLFPIFIFQAKAVKNNIRSSAMNGLLGRQAGLQLLFMVLLGLGYVSTKL